MKTFEQKTFEESLKDLVYFIKSAPEAEPIRDLFEEELEVIRQWLIEQ